MDAQIKQLDGEMQLLVYENYTKFTRAVDAPRPGPPAYGCGSRCREIRFAHGSQGGGPCRVEALEVHQKDRVVGRVGGSLGHRL